MTKGCISTDLESLKREYEHKINKMSEKLRSGEYHGKTTFQKQKDTLAGYMNALDQLNWLMDLRFKYKDFEPFNYSEYKRMLERY